MNISCPPIQIANIPPSFQQLGTEGFRALLYLLVPGELMYFSIYFKINGAQGLYKSLTVLSLAAFWLAGVITPIHCVLAKCLQHFAVAIGTMKILDLYAQRNSLPKYTATRGEPAAWLLALLLVTELRYESFTPNHVRVPMSKETFSEPLQLGIHLVAFMVLQSFPQIYPTVLAFEVVLAIYIIWTWLQLILRYKNSPALFGPLYLAESLTGFWSETWHNAFASPCTSLAYRPIRRILTKYGMPVSIARSSGVMGAFILMAIFHMYALWPVMTNEGLQRIGIFFLLNGVGSVTEAMIWGKKHHWVKTLLAWSFETALATRTAEKAGIPNGLSKIRWREMCEGPRR